jgi:hypothetical protein
MRALMLIAAATMVASCTQPATPPGAALAQETAGRAAGPAQSCIPTEPVLGLRVIDSQTIAFGEGKTIYISHLGAPCPGIEPTTTLIVEPGTAGQYCRGDHVRGREMGASIAGPVCILGDWVPYRSS